MQNTEKIKRGDTMIEVLLAITIFCAVIVGSLGLMNRTLASSQGVLEATMVRNEIDAQAEAIRYMRNTYIAARNNGTLPDDGNKSAWKTLVSKAYSANDAKDLLPIDDTCKNNKNKLTTKTFFIDVHSKNALDNINASNSAIKYTQSTDVDKILNPTTYARVTDSGKSEGLWALTVKSDSSTDRNGQPEFYDFYIRACWYEPGHAAATTIGTLIRLNNPDYPRSK